MKRSISLMAVLAAVLLSVGCARTLIPAEILQVSEHQFIYTAYNLWYTNPMDIDCSNVLKGSILPFGTQVIITKATEKEIEFRTVRGKKNFCIKFDHEKRMQSPEDYMRALFTTRNTDDLTEGIRPVVYEKLARGLVTIGMTKQEVLLAYGPPCASRTPDITVDTWCYWSDYLDSVRIVFNKDKVVDIIRF